MSKLSIITTVFNAEEYLHASLDSIINQSFKDFEWILVDDGCTDGSRRILEKYASKTNSKLIINKQNFGIPFSRNRALLQAEGEYVAIHDADDISLPERMSKEVSVLDRQPSIVFLGSYATKISSNGENIGIMAYPPVDTTGAFALITRIRLNPVIDPSCMYRREVIIKHGGYTMNPELRTALDFELWCRLLTYGYKMCNIPEILIKYRINPKGVTRTENSKMVEATNAIWACFRRKNFADPKLDAGLFEEDLF